MVEFVGHVGHHALVSGPLVHAVDGGGRLGVGLIRVGGRRVAVAVGRLVGALADMVLRHRHEPGGHGDEQQRGYDDYGGDYRRDAARPDARFPRGLHRVVLLVWRHRVRLVWGMGLTICLARDERG